MSLKFQFSSTNGWLSKTIRFRTNSEFSHVDAVTPEGKYFGAQTNGGVWLRDPAYEKWTARLVVEIPVTAAQDEAFWAFLAAQSGKKYDYTAIFGLVLNRPWHTPEQWFCSKLQAVALDTAKIMHIYGNSGFLSPEVLRLMLMELPGATEKRIL